MALIVFGLTTRVARLEPPPLPLPPPRPRDDEPRQARVPVRPLSSPDDRAGASGRQSRPATPTPSQATTPQQARQAIGAQPLPRTDDLSELSPHVQDLIYKPRIESFNDQRAGAARDALQRLAPQRSDFQGLNAATASAEYSAALTHFNADPDVAELRRIESEATAQRSTLPGSLQESACTARPKGATSPAASHSEAQQDEIDPVLREEPASREMWRGLNHREHAGVGVDARRGAIRANGGWEVNRRTGDGHVSVSRETVLAANGRSGNTAYGMSERVGVETRNVRYERQTHYREQLFNANTAPIADSRVQDHSGMKPEFNLGTWEDSKSVSRFDNTLVSGEHGSIEVSALGAEASGAASYGFGRGTARAQAAGSASIYAVKVEAEVHAGPASARGAAQVGAEVEGATEVEFDPLHGDLNASAEAGAFIGARAEGEVGLGLGPAEASAKGDVGAGLGADVKADIGFDDGTFEFSFGAHGYLGVGGGGEVEFEVDVPELAGNVVDIGQGAVNIGGNVVGAVGDASGNVMDKVSFWN